MTALRPVRNSASAAMAFALAAAVLAVGASAVASDSGFSGDADSRAVFSVHAAMHALHAATLRAVGAKSATNWLCGSRLSPAAADEWTRTLAARDGFPSGDSGTVSFPASLASDFLAGSTVLVGPCDSHGAVFAYANPFWDAVLFVRTGGGDLPSPEEDDAGPAESSGLVALLDGDDDGSASGGAAAGRAGSVFALRRVPKVEQLRWMDGDTLRGGPPLGTEVGDPFAVVLWRRSQSMEAAFRRIHPDGGFGCGARQIVAFANGVEDADSATVAAAMRGRASSRAAQLVALASDPALVRMAAFSARLLREGDEKALLRCFDSPEHAVFARRLAALRADVRESFSPSGARIAPDGVQMLFSATDFPQFVALVTFPAARLSGVSMIPVQMEWYDLDRADALLAIWSDAGKEDGR